MKSVFLSSILHCVLLVLAQGYAIFPAFQGLQSHENLRASLGSSVCPWTRKDQCLASWQMVGVGKSGSLMLSPSRTRVAHAGKSKGADGNVEKAADLRRQGFEAAMTGQFQAAADLLQEYMSRVDTADVSALNCRGAMLAELSEWDSAEECFQSAITAATVTGDDQACINAHYNLGNILYKQRKFSSAASSFRSVLALRDDDVQALNNLGLALSDQGDKEAALESFSAAAELDPEDPVALTNQANVLADLGRHVDAVLAYEEAAQRGADQDLSYWLNLGVAARRAGMKTVAEEALLNVIREDPTHVLAKRLLGTVRGGGEEEEGGAGSLEEEAAYAAALFDGYAEDFERELVDELQYGVPGRLVGMLVKVAGRGDERKEGGRTWGTAVDVGCGSGLVGDYIRGFCARLVGVDASAAMVEQARARGGEEGEKIYDEVEHGELVACLAGMEEGADVVVAADVMCYISDLSSAFDAAAGALRRGEGEGGLLAFSTESCDAGGGGKEGKGWQLKSSGRYGHDAAWVRASVEAAGMAVAASPCWPSPSQSDARSLHR